MAVILEVAILVLVDVVAARFSARFIANVSRCLSHRPAREVRCEAARFSFVQFAPW